MLNNYQEGLFLGRFLNARHLVSLQVLGIFPSEAVAWAS